MGEEGGPSLLSASARVSCGRLRFRVNAILRPDTRQLLLWIEQRQSSPARNWLSHPWESDTLRRLAVLAGGGVVETGARTGHPADAFCSVNAGIGFRLTCAVARRADAQ